MRALAPVLIVLILVIGVLIGLWMNRRSNRKKKEWEKLSDRANLAEETLGQIANELSLAQSANTSLDTLILDSIIREYDHKRTISNSKEIAR
jgi:uncharacterized membrane-anchored protein YhcB (DUF1043 family)